MKKIMYFILIIFVLSYCGPKQEKIERYMEDGVEVVVNHLEPYKIKGEPSNLILEEEFTIDTERDELVEIGLTDVSFADTDSSGNIYFVGLKSSENLIYKFDSRGNFLISFGRKGQGPGEIQKAFYFSIDSKDNIFVSDTDNHKIVIFNNDGSLIKETRYNMNFLEVHLLENRKYLGKHQIIDYSREFFPYRLVLYSSEFEEIKELDVFKYPNPLKGNKAQWMNLHFGWKVVKDKIYVANMQREYEILVYDLEGNLLRKIRKEYKPMLFPEKFKKEHEELFLRNPSISKYRYIPKYIPPFNSFFADEEERLFVMTYEKGSDEGEYIHDIFNPDGILIDRKSIGSYGRLYNTLPPLRGIAKNNRLYCLREKESGYKELMVYKMRWE